MRVIFEKIRSVTRYMGSVIVKMTSYRQNIVIYCGVMLKQTFLDWWLDNELISSGHIVVMGCVSFDVFGNLGD
jgi:hypothetical protein